MEREILQVSKRSKLGTGNSRRLRSKQLVPGVLYGKEVDAFAIEVEAKPLVTLLGKVGESALVDVRVDGTSYTSLLKEVQRHPVSGEVLHVDFHRVSMEEEIEVRVPLVISGAEDCPGAQEGGVVETLISELEVRCLPLNIPKSIELDISELAIGGTVHVSELGVPGDVKVLTASDQTVVTVSRPSEVEVEEPTVGEPEVVGAEGEEGEEGEARPEGEKVEGKPEGEKKEEDKPVADGKDGDGSDKKKDGK